MEFAKLCSGSSEAKVLPPIAAGLIAQHLHVVFDAEFGDKTNAIKPDEVLVAAFSSSARPQH